MADVDGTPCIYNSPNNKFDMLILLTVLVGCLGLLLHWLYMKPPKFPPGPPHLPILGNGLSMPATLPHLMMEKWREQYGPVVGLMLGPSLKAVAICGATTVMEVLRREEFQARPHIAGIKERTFNKSLGVFFTDGPFWVNQRRFTLRHLRDFGFGKKSMEGLILEEVDDLIDEVRDKTVTATDIFGLRAVNVLWAIMAGKRFDSNDEQLKRILEAVNIMFRSGKPTGNFLQLLLPFIVKLAPGLMGKSEEVQIRTNIQDFARDVIRKHMENFDEDNPRDFIDVYLKEIRDGQDDYFTEDGLVSIIFDLFGAGAESVSNTLGFIAMYLAMYPNIQDKVHVELDTVIGKGRKISLDDKHNLPYMEAVIAEVSRINTIAPLCPPHNVETDTYLNGYILPKDTMMFISLWSVLHDKEHWGDPEVFRPERFINPNTGAFVRDPWMINFGMGKRICLGEPLARNNLFIFLGRILQEFQISLPPHSPTPSTEPLSGFTTAPKPFQVVMNSR